MGIIKGIVRYEKNRAARRAIRKAEKSRGQAFGDFHFLMEK